MRKVLSFSLFLMAGLVASQLLPGALGAGYGPFKAAADTLLYVCLGFIMINVGREFEIDKTRWRSYTADYFIAMATAALPWLLIVLYYVFVLLPSDLWSDPAAWKENLLLSRFAAPTSAGILFTMLAALKLKESWIYRKIQVLAIFDDLDTILLMIPLQILMIGLRWQMFAIVAIVVVLLAVGWRRQGTWDVRQDWKRILGLSVAVCALTQAIYLATKHWYGPENSIHIEVLLPAFVVGMLMRHRHIDTPAERRIATGISFLFMLLVGMSMPLMTGSGAGHQRHAHSHEQHEEERDARGDAAFGGRVDVPVAHQHPDDEGREQHLDMDAVLGTVPVFRGEVDRLRQRADRDREPEDAFPVLPHVPRALPAPADGEQHDDDGHDGEHLPPQADHQDLQGDHQQDGVQVVEDGEHLDFAVDPALLELQRRQHREEDARRGRGGEAAQQQVLLPGRRVAPEIGGKQHEDVVEHDEQPGQRRRGHGDEVVGRVGAPARLVDFELAAHVDHDESQADIQQRVGRGLERAVTRAERAGKQLGGHESRHEEEGEGEYFAHGSESLFGRSYSFGRIRPRGRRCIRKHMNAFGCRVRTPFRGTASGFTGQRYDFAADSQTGGEAVAAFGGGFRGVKKITAGESAIHNYFVTLRCKTDRKF